MLTDENWLHLWINSYLPYGNIILGWHKRHCISILTTLNSNIAARLFQFVYLFNLWKYNTRI